MSPTIRRADFYAYQVDMLDKLSPPIVGFGVGGSTGAGKADTTSDLDFFILVPDDELFSFIRFFPDAVTHPWTCLAFRDRGFWPDFGYQFTYVYSNECMVDYFINSPSSLRLTPMALKTKVIRDADGKLTEYQENINIYCNSVVAHAEYLASASNDVLIELLKIQKHVRRGDLLPVLHRFERLRLIYLALLRHKIANEPYVPHDADKRVQRILGPHAFELISETFKPSTALGALEAFELIFGLLTNALIEGGAPGTSAHDGFWRLYYSASSNIIEHLTELARFTDSLE